MAHPLGPPQTDMSASPEVQGWLASLHGGRWSARRKRWIIGALAALVLLLLLAIVGWIIGTLRYATIADLEVARDASAPDCLTLSYRPLSSGRVRFQYGDRELRHRTSSSETGQPQEIRWRLPGLRAGEVVRVTYREGWSRVTVEKIVPELPFETATKAAGLGLYARRTLPGRPQWIGGFGGSPGSETAVTEGLAWLARHQAADGSWSQHCLGKGPQSRCDQASSCSAAGQTFEMAHTGLALLAFQGDGHYPANGSRYSETVRRGLEWMIAHQQPDGALVGSQSSTGFTKYHKNYMYEHGIAAYAMGDACAASASIGQPCPDSYLRALRKAIQFIETQQHRDGGWRYNAEAREAGDTSVSGWQVFAIRAAHDAGMSANEACLKGLAKFFRVRATSSGRTGYQNLNVQTDATTGMGMLARQFVLGDPRGELVHKAAVYLAGLAEKMPPGHLPTGEDRDYYLWYHCTLAMFAAGGEPWNSWNAGVREDIIALQCKSDCQRGSWDPDERWGDPGGRIYSTALAVLALEVYYRYAISEETAKYRPH